MSMDHAGDHAAHIDHDTGVHADHHDAGYSSARASMLEKGFIWIAWALGAAFIAATMALYFPGFLSTSPNPPDAVPPIASSPASGG